MTAGAPRRRWRYREPAAREQGEPEAEEDPAGWACLSGEAVRDRRAGDHAEKDAGAALALAMVAAQWATGREELRVDRCWFLRRYRTTSLPCSGPTSASRP